MKPTIDDIVTLLQDAAAKRLRPFGFNVFVNYDGWRRLIAARVAHEVRAEGHAWWGQITQEEFQFDERDILHYAKDPGRMLLYMLDQMTERVLVRLMRSYGGPLPPPPPPPPPPMPRWMQLEDRGIQQ